MLFTRNLSSSGGLLPSRSVLAIARIEQFKRCKCLTRNLTSRPRERWNYEDRSFLEFRQFAVPRALCVLSTQLIDCHNIVNAQQSVLSLRRAECCRRRSGNECGCVQRDRNDHRWETEGFRVCQVLTAQVDTHFGAPNFGRQTVCAQSINLNLNEERMENGKNEWKEGQESKLNWLNNQPMTVISVGEPLGNSVANPVNFQCRAVAAGKRKRAYHRQCLWKAFQSVLASRRSPNTC